MISAVCPNTTAGVVSCEKAAQHPFNTGRGRGHRCLTNEAKALVDGDVRLLAVGRISNFCQRYTVGPVADISIYLERPTNVRVIFSSLIGLVGSDTSPLDWASLISSFSSSILRCWGAKTSVALTIRPQIGTEPLFLSRQSKAFITCGKVPVRVIRLRNKPMVISPGVRSPSAKLRNRIHDSRSQIMNYIIALARLCLACRINALNGGTTSKCGRRPLVPSPLPKTLSGTAGNTRNLPWHLGLLVDRPLR